MEGKRLVITLNEEELRNVIIDCVSHCLKHYRQPEAEPRDTMTVPESAEFLGISKASIYGKVSRNEIPFMKPKGSSRLYFSRQDLEKYIKDGRQKTRQEVRADAVNLIKKKKL